MRKTLFLRIFFVFTLLLIVMGAVSFYGYFKLKETKDKLYQKTIVLEATQGLMRYSEQSFSIMKEYVYTQSPQELESLRSEFAMSSYNSNYYYNTLKDNVEEDYNLMLIERYFNLGYETSKELIYIHDFHLSTDNDLILTSEEKVLMLAIKSYQKQSAELIDQISKKASDEYNQAIDEFDRTQKNTSMLLIIVFVSSFAIALVFARNVTRPIVELKKAAKAFGEGRMDTKVEIKGDDEISQLNASFNEMVEKINKAYTQIEMESKEIEAANKKLESLNTLKDEFISNVSHELKTPLTSIKSYCGILSDGLIGRVNPKQKESLMIINSAADSLLALINSLLDVSRYEKGKYDLMLQRADVSKIIKEVVTELKPSIREAGGNIVLDTGKDPVFCMIDKEKAKEVFRNIISNSIKYRDKGQKLIIRVTIGKDKPKRFAEISIKDNGIGISKENLRHVFDKFYQVDQSLSRKVGGAGLGLSITNHIVKLHKGKIKIDSEIDKGTKTIVSLPLNPKKKRNH